MLSVGGEWCVYTYAYLYKHAINSNVYVKHVIYVIVNFTLFCFLYY